MRRFLFEADDDKESGGTNNNDQTANDAADNNDSGNENDTNEGDDNNTDQNDENQDDNNEEDNQNEEENTEDENQDDNNEEEDNYDINDDDNGGDDENQDEGGDEESTDEGGDESSEESKADALKLKDRELFNSLSIAEQQIKIKELKSQFSSLYNNCSSIIERLNDLSIELIDEYPQLKKVNAVLYELKDMISFYILNIYDTKSFFENDIIFNRYLAILNSVKTVLTTIKNDKNDDK